MRKAIDFTSWEVGFARGQVTHAMVAGLVLLTVLGTLAELVHLRYRWETGQDREED